MNDDDRRMLKAHLHLIAYHLERANALLASPPAVSVGEFKVRAVLDAADCQHDWIYDWRAKGYHCKACGADLPQGESCLHRWRFDAEADEYRCTCCGKTSRTETTVTS